MNGTPYDLRNIWYGKYAYSGGAISVTGGRQLGLAMKATITPNFQEAPLWAEGAKAENIRRFKDGSITLGVKSIDSTTKTDLYGHTATTDGTKGTKDDNSNYVVIAFYAPEKDAGTDKYYALCLKKVQFSDAPTNYQATGDSITWATPELPGTFMADDNGEWYEDAVFDTEAEALAWVKTQVGLYCATPTATPAAGAVTSGAEITLSSATDGATIYYTMDGTTPTTSSTEYDSTDKPAITATTTIKAIAVKAGMENSAVLTAAYTTT